MLVNHKVSARGNLAPTFLLTYFWRSGYRASVTSFHSASGSTAKVTATASDRNWTSFSFLLFCFDSDLFRVMRSRRCGAVRGTEVFVQCTHASISLLLFSRCDYRIMTSSSEKWLEAPIVPSHRGLPTGAAICLHFLLSRLVFSGILSVPFSFLFFLYNKCIILWLPH